MKLKSISAKDLAAIWSQEEAWLEKNLRERGFQTSLDSLRPEVVRAFLIEMGKPFKSEVISFQMLKGGVAKTTSALNFGLRASMYGARVLMIDLDQQANLTFALGVRDESLPVWLDFVEKKKSLEDLILPLKVGVDLIPSSLNNSVLERVLLQSPRNWKTLIKGPLAPLKTKYDLIIFDTAPHLSLTNTAVTCASDTIVFPVNPDRFSLLGLSQHLHDLNDLEKEFELSVRKRILFTKFDSRESISHQSLEYCLQRYPDLLMKNYVRHSSEIKSTQGTERTIYQTKNSAQQDYDRVTREILDLI